MKGHERTVKSVCISADDKYAVSGSYDNTIRLWSVKTGQLVKTINDAHNDGRSFT